MLYHQTKDPLYIMCVRTFAVTKTQCYPENENENKVTSRAQFI